MRLFAILVTLLALFALLIMYSALAVSDRADEWEEGFTDEEIDELFSDWDKFCEDWARLGDEVFGKESDR